MPNLRRVGHQAEDRAADYLVGKGYTIVTRRHKTASGELDIVALDGDTIVIVEVKERRTDGFVPEEALDALKVSRLIAAAGEYLHAMGESHRDVRIDVIAIDRSGLRHIPNAVSG
jgi:putative endonuclease